jgi:thiol-disulfide isomerase/thioredoxin
MLKAATLMIALILLAPISFGQRAPQSPPLVARDISGRTIRLNSYRGRVVLVNFWATWCPPCRVEMPDLVRWQREYGARGLQIIGITYPPSRRSEVRRFVRSIGVNYPVIIGTRDMAERFGVGGILPVTVIIDREGRVHDRALGILEPEDFDQKVRPLLQ